MISRVDIGIVSNNGTVWIDKLVNQEVVNRYVILKTLNIPKGIMKYLNEYIMGKVIDCDDLNALSDDYDDVSTTMML